MGIREMQQSCMAAKKLLLATAPELPAESILLDTDQMDAYLAKMYAQKTRVKRTPDTIKIIGGAQFGIDLEELLGGKCETFSIPKK